MKLKIKNLSFSFHQDLALLQDLSFTVQSKECFFIKGSNGSGKTTLLRIIAGLQSFSKGQIEIEPQQESFSCELLGTEKNGMFPSLPALDNLMFWSKLSGQDLSQKELLAKASLWGLSNVFSLTQIPLKKFSTGMKRKIALLKVFLSPAQILLFDEPMNGLDQKSSEFFISSLLTAKSQGKIILISSHHNSSLYERAIDKTIELSSGSRL